MRESDIVLAFFVLAAFAFRGRGHWKRTVLRVMIGVLIADVTGAVLIAAFYHWYPSILDRVSVLMPIGALVGGFYDLLTPATQTAQGAFVGGKIEKKR
jgi:hypothetical protein